MTDRQTDRHLLAANNTQLTSTAQRSFIKTALVSTEKNNSLPLIFCNVAFRSQNCTKTAWDAAIEPTDILILHVYSCSCYRSLQLNVLLQCVFKSEPYIVNDVFKC